LAVVLLILRTYALYDRNHRALLFMLVVSAGVLGFGTVSGSIYKGTELRVDERCFAVGSGE
jgi:hypothetical protein